ncbi:MAG: histidine kinase, partial [Paludibacter sp.]
NNLDQYKFTQNKMEFNGTVVKNIHRGKFEILPDESLVYFDSNDSPCFIPIRPTGFGVNFSFLEKMFIDREKNLWVTTNNGLYNYFNLNIEEYKLNVSEPDNFWSIVEDNDRNMWFGSYGSGLWMLNPSGKVLPIFKNTKSWTQQYMGSRKSNDGTLFLPFSDGILKYKKNQPPIVSNTASCLSVYYDEKNKIEYYSGVDTTLNIFGLYKGIGSNKRFFHWKVGFPVSIIKDSAGHIRLGSFRGQGVLSADSIITDTRKHDYNGVICMAIDNKGRIWKGTDRGVFVEYPNGSESHVAATQIKGQITSIMNYRDKYLLVGGIRSLFIVDIFTYKTGASTKLFEIGYDAGFTGLESGQNGFNEDHNGDVWLCTALSVLKFNPDKLVQAQTQIIPHIRIASIAYSKDNSKWYSSFFDDKPIALKSSNKFLKFDYVANSISAPKSLRFKYRLVGFSDKWSEPVYTKSVSYTNIGFGKYRFEVQCSMDGIHWSEAAQSPVVEITVPFYLRPISIFTYIFLAILMSVYLTRLFVKRNQQKKMKELNRIKLENELQLNTLRSKIIPHFTNNVLSAIGYFAMTDKLKAGHYISVFSRFTQLTLANADKNYIALSDELNYIRNYLELEKMRFTERFDYHIEIDEAVPLDFLIPTMILHTYCDNAIRHGLVNKDDKGMLLIQIKNESSEILLVITDNGIGRTRAKELGTTGNGKGLQLIEAQLDFYNMLNEKFISQEIIDLHEDGNPLGTKIELRIPKGYKFSTS